MWFEVDWIQGPLVADIEHQITSQDYQNQEWTQRDEKSDVLRNNSKIIDLCVHTSVAFFLHVVTRAVRWTWSPTLALAKCIFTVYISLKVYILLNWTWYLYHTTRKYSEHKKYVAISFNMHISRSIVPKDHWIVLHSSLAVGVTLCYP